MTLLSFQDLMCGRILFNMTQLCSLPFLPYWSCTLLPWFLPYTLTFPQSRKFLMNSNLFTQGPISFQALQTSLPGEMLIFSSDSSTCLLELSFQWTITLKYLSFLHHLLPLTWIQVFLPSVALMQCPVTSFEFSQSLAWHASSNNLHVQMVQGWLELSSFCL